MITSRKVLALPSPRASISIARKASFSLGGSAISGSRLRRIAVGTSRRRASMVASFTWNSVIGCATAPDGPPCTGARAFARLRMLQLRSSAPGAALLAMFRLVEPLPLIGTLTLNAAGETEISAGQVEVLRVKVPLALRKPCTST